jgi:hypothetical protein
VHHAASAITAPDTDHLPAYRQFHDAVARAQLAAWLPRGRHTIVDISGPRAPAAELALLAGHHVVRVIDARTASRRAAGGAWTVPREPRAPAPLGLPREPKASASPGLPRGPKAPASPGLSSGAGATREGDASRGAGGERPAREPKAPASPGLRSDAGPTREGDASRGAGGERDKHSERGDGASGTILADSSRLSFLSDGCADDVIAEDRALSTYLAAEAIIAEIARVLRAGGRVLACVDSLVFGMAVLAGQHHWAHLADLPHAEVVLVPWPDGTITRCYGPDQARELFSGAGLTVDWIRPRTVFSESMVTPVLRRDPASLPRLVRAELAARSDESLGAQLVISASKKG